MRIRMELEGTQSVYSVAATCGLICSILAVASAIAVCSSSGVMLLSGCADSAADFNLAR